VRRLAYFVLVLMALSFVLVPFSTVHAHFVDDHSVLHGGHVHEVDHESTTHDDGIEERFVSAPLVVADKTPGKSFGAWAPVFWFLAALTLGIAAIREVFRPPGDDVCPASDHTFQLPPSRGPPLASV
jgi:hypothetical protein